MLRHDLIVAFRLIRRSPTFAAAVILTLALGISVNTTLFALVNAVLFRPLGVADAERLVSVRLVDRERPRRDALGLTPYPLLHLVAAQREIFTDVAAFFEMQESLTTAGESSEIVVGEYVSPAYFTVLGVNPLLGRVFRPGDELEATTRDVVVISERLWRRSFRADPAVLGAPVRINGYPLTVIGVLPDTFRGLQLPSIRPSDAFVHASLIRSVSSRGQVDGALTSAEWFGWRLFARLQPNVHVGKAQAALAALGNQLEHESHGLRHHQLRAQLLNDDYLNPKMDVFAIPLAASVMGLTVLVLVVVCVNLTNLLLARVAFRQAEMATRFALGASRWRLFRLALTESLVLASAGGAVGVLLAVGFARAIADTLPAHSLMYTMSIGSVVDVRMLLFTALISVLAGILFGVAPALRAAQVNMRQAVTGEMSIISPGRAASRLRELLVGVQLGVTCFILILAALFIRAMIRVESRDIGLGNGRVVLFGLDLRLHKEYDDARGQILLKTLRDEAARLPGTKRAALIDVLPIGATRDVADILLPSEDPRRGTYSSSEPNYYRFGDVLRVGPGYFEAVNTPLVRGRGFEPADVQGSRPVSVVSELTARRLWPGEDPIGKRVQVKRGRPMVEVVGVARDTDVRFVGERRALLFYVPFEQHYTPKAQLLVESDDRPSIVIERLRQRLRAIDRAVAVVNASTLNEWIAMWTYPYRLASALVGTFGFLTLLVSVVGIHGLTAYMTAQRTREIGIRLACGASRGDIARGVIGRGLRPVTVGIAIGALCALFAVTVISRVFFRLLDRDPIVAVATCLFLLGASLVSVSISARRAMNLRPVQALRHF